MDDIRDLLDVGVKDSDSVRIGEHKTGSIRSADGSQCIEIDASLIIGFDIHYLKSGHMGGSGVCAVR